MNKTTVTRSLLYAAAVGAGMSALWLDYPIMVLDRPIRILLVREAIFIAAVAAVWLRFFASTLQGRSGLFRENHGSSESHFRWMPLAVVLIVAVTYFITFRIDVASGNTYISKLADRPWRLFEPSHLWGTMAAYRPVGLMFTGLVGLLAPHLLVVSGATLHAINAILVARLALMFWPGRQEVALKAALFAAVMPQAVSTVVDPLNQPYLVCGVFYFAAILAFEKGLRHERWAPILLSLAFTGLALVTLEFAVTLPLVLTLVGLSARHAMRRPRLVLQAVSLQWALAIAYVLGYLLYLQYCKAAGQPTKEGMLFPLNVKRITLSMTYVPFWSFLFSFAHTSGPHRLWALAVLTPVLTLPLVWIVRYRAWQDRGFTLGVMAASVAVLPVATIFDVPGWGNERYGYLSYLWLCLPLAWVLPQWTREKRIGATAGAKTVALSLAVPIAIGALGVEQIREYARFGTVSERMVDAVVERLPERDASAAMSFVALDEHSMPFQVYDWWARTMTLVPRKGIAFETIQQRSDVLHAPLNGAVRRIDVEWAQSRMKRQTGSGASPVPWAVLHWDQQDEKYVDVAARLQARYDAGGGGEIHPGTVRAKEGVVASADGSFVQRGQHGNLIIAIDARVPGPRDELILRMTIRPRGFVPPADDSRIVLEWAHGDLPMRSRTLALSIPVIADGLETEYRLRLGTAVSWLIADTVRELSLTLPHYPTGILVRGAGVTR